MITLPKKMPGKKDTAWNRQMPFKKPEGNNIGTLRDNPEYPGWNFPKNNNRSPNEPNQRLANAE